MADRHYCRNCDRFIGAGVDHTRDCPGFPDDEGRAITKSTSNMSVHHLGADKIKIEAECPFCKVRGIVNEKFECGQCGATYSIHLKYSRDDLM